MHDRKIWVLVVEDEETSRKIVANQLHDNGFEVICAENGEVAMEIIRYSTPDCILLDMLMPKMHGHAFLAQLRQKNQSLPVIVMSAIESTPDLVATMESLGIVGWLSKPFDSEKVLKLITTAVGGDIETSKNNSDANAS